MNEDSKFGLRTFVLNQTSQLRFLTKKLIYSKHTALQQKKLLELNEELLKAKDLKYEALVNSISDERTTCPHAYQCPVKDIGLK